jgi:hypothetical protein
MKEFTADDEEQTVQRNKLEQLAIWIEWRNAAGY